MDKRAVDILFSAYWSAKGWKQDRNIAPGDFEYAKAKGVMFEPVLLNHDQLVSWALKARDLNNRKAIANAFVFSLGTRQLQYR